jgi:pyruvate dehydrogenase E1 component alpha subunit
MDVLSIYRGLKKAVEKARQGKPSFIEIRTYRFRGHSMSDPIHSHYRTKAEVEEQKERDPIKLWRESLVARGIISDEEIQKMDKDINAEMKKAAEKAELSPEPDPADVYKFVLAE